MPACQRSACRKPIDGTHIRVHLGGEPINVCSFACMTRLMDAVRFVEGKPVAQVVDLQGDGRGNVYTNARFIRV